MPTTPQGRHATQCSYTNSEEKKLEKSHQPTPYRLYGTTRADKLIDGSYTCGYLGGKGKLSQWQKYDKSHQHQPTATGDD